MVSNSWIYYTLLKCLPERATRVLGAARLLVLLREELEAALLGLVARLDEASVRLLAGRGLLTAHDLAPLVLHQILACKSTLGVLRRAVKYLRLRANRKHMSVHVSNGIEDFFQSRKVTDLLREKEIPFSQSTSPYA